MKATCVYWPTELGIFQLFSVSILSKMLLITSRKTEKKTNNFALKIKYA